MQNLTRKITGVLSTRDDLLSSKGKNIVRIFPNAEALEAPNDKTIVAIILYYLDVGSMCPS